MVKPNKFPVLLLVPLLVGLALVHDRKVAFAALVIDAVWEKGRDFDPVLLAVLLDKLLQLLILLQGPHGLRPRLLCQLSVSLYTLALTLSHQATDHQPLFGAVDLH